MTPPLAGEDQPRTSSEHCADVDQVAPGAARVGGTLVGVGPKRRSLLCRALLLTQEFGATCTVEVQRRFDPLYSSNSSVAVLTTLALDGPQRPSQLQPHTGLTSAGLAHLVDRLVSAEVVSRSGGGLVHDQRAVLVELTPLGRRREAAVVKAIFAGAREARPTIKELVSTLEQAGARSSAGTADLLPARRPASRAARAMAQIGITLIRALQLPEPYNEATDQTAALALSAVHLTGSCRPGHLADVLAITTGGVTRLLDRLESNGFVERSLGAVPEDRRSVIVSITPAGLEQLDLVLEQVSGHLDGLLDGVLAVARLVAAEGA
jgi:DNA-binding MarR family transcriptional regulator